MAETSSRKLFLNLFVEFFKIGLFTIGGGAVMIPQMQQLAVEDKKWLTSEEMLDCIALSQSLPGVIAVNMATFIGYRKKGILGGMVATIGVTLPSFVIIMLAVLFLKQVGDNPFVIGAFAGVKAAVCGLILVTAYKLIKQISSGERKIKKLFVGSLALLSTVAVGFLGVNAIIIILGGIVIGIAYMFISEGVKKL